MANKTPHVVGGGLGTFRKEAQAKHKAKAKADQERHNREAIHSLVDAIRK